MTRFAVLISCLNPQVCALPHSPIQSYFEAESIEMCQTNVATMIELEGLDPRQLRITCSLERKA